MKHDFVKLCRFIPRRRPFIVKGWFLLIRKRISTRAFECAKRQCGCHVVCKSFIALAPLVIFTAVEIVNQRLCVLLNAVWRICKDRCAPVLIMAVFWDAIENYVTATKLKVLCWPTFMRNFNNSWWKWKKKSARCSCYINSEFKFFEILISMSTDPKQRTIRT